MDRSLPYGRLGSGTSGASLNTPLILSDQRSKAFIRENTSLISPLHVPEISLHLADEAHALWHKTEEELTQIGLPPPYWAFAWAGGQAVARYILDHPEEVEQKTVLDFASGSGLVAIAAAQAGAAHVTAADIDDFSHFAIELNSAHNAVTVTSVSNNLIDTDLGWDIILAGDVFYDKPLADQLIPWFDQLTKRGAHVIVGDPGRSYLPRERLRKLCTYQIPVTRALEDADVKKTTVWRYHCPDLNM